MMINNGAKIIRKIFLDRDGKLRPIYVIAIVLTALFILAGVIVDGAIDIMRNQLIASGDIKMCIRDRCTTGAPRIIWRGQSVS